MKMATKNALIRKALGMREVLFRYYGPARNESHWDVRMEDGSSLKVSLPNLATESTVLRAAAHKLAEMGREVRWPA